MADTVVGLIDRYKNELRDLMKVNVPVPQAEDKTAVEYPISLLFKGNAEKAAADLCAFYEVYKKWYEGATKKKQDASSRPTSILGTLGMVYDHCKLIEEDGKDRNQSLDSFVQNAIADLIAASQVCRKPRIKWIQTYSASRDLDKCDQSDNMAVTGDTKKIKEAEKMARSQAEEKTEGIQRLTVYLVYVLIGAYEKKFEHRSFYSQKDIAHLHEALYQGCQQMNTTDYLHTFWAGAVQDQRIHMQIFCRSNALVQSSPVGKTCPALALQRSFFMFTFIFSSLFGDIDSAPDPDLDVCHYFRMQGALFGSHLVIASLISALWDELYLLVGLHLIKAGISQPGNDYLSFQLDYEDMANYNLASSLPDDNEKTQQRLVVDESTKRLLTLEKTLALEGKLTSARFTELQELYEDIASVEEPKSGNPLSLQKEICPLVIALRQIAGGIYCRSDRRDFLARVIRLAMAKLRSLPYQYAREDGVHLHDTGLVASISEYLLCLTLQKIHALHPMSVLKSC